MSTLTSSAEEDLRYYSYVGDEKGVKKLIDMSVEVNSRNPKNGWTPLHWAAHKNHANIVKMLLENGANPEIVNDERYKPLHLATSSVIRNMLGESGNPCHRIVQLPIHNNSEKRDKCEERNKRNLSDDCENKNSTKEIILKVRIADAEDPDFNEIELNENELTVEKLIDVCCNDLKFDKKNILKIRKLPNTVLRKNEEVERLEDYQEIEFVLHRNHQQD